MVAADIQRGAGRKETVAAVRSEGGEAFFVKVDVSDSSDVQDLVRSCMDRHAALDVLFNCAAVSLAQKDCPVGDLDEEDWNTTFAINLTGTFLCCKYAVPIMVERRKGSIINVISRACYVGNDLHAYSASKSGVLSLTKNIAVSYAAHNVRANAISPGGIDTPMSLQVRNTPETAATYMRGLPLNRLAEPVEDVPARPVPGVGRIAPRDRHRHPHRRGGLRAVGRHRPDPPRCPPEPVHPRTGRPGRRRSGDRRHRRDRPAGIQPGEITGFPAGGRPPIERIGLPRFVTIGCRASVVGPRTHTLSPRRGVPPGRTRTGRCKELHS